MMSLDSITALYPPFTDDPIDRLKHVLAVYADSPDDRMVLDAIRDQRYPAPAMTGITLGDLRAIAALLDR